MHMVTEVQKVPRLFNAVGLASLLVASCLAPERVYRADPGNGGEAGAEAGLGGASGIGGGGNGQGGNAGSAAGAGGIGGGGSSGTGGSGTGGEAAGGQAGEGGQAGGATGGSAGTSGAAGGFVVREHGFRAINRSVSGTGYVLREQALEMGPRSCGTIYCVTGGIAP